MKTPFKVLLSLILLTMSTAGCGFLGFVPGNRVEPSDTIVREARQASGFTGIDMGTFGRVILSLGESESVTVSGSDNLVALVEANVRNGVLYLEATEEFYVTSFSEENMLTFTIVAREIDAVTISGIGALEIETLRSPRLIVTVSGGGDVRINQLATDDLTVVLSGTGTIQIAGEADRASIDLSGTGDVNMPDLEIQTAYVSLSGMGGATLWVTDLLTGEISGAGSASYYGNPQTDVSTTGLGEFNALGDH